MTPFRSGGHWLALNMGLFTARPLPEARHVANRSPPSAMRVIAWSSGISLSSAISSARHAGVGMAECRVSLTVAISQATFRPSKLRGSVFDARQMVRPVERLISGPSPERAAHTAPGFAVFLRGRRASIL